MTLRTSFDSVVVYPQVYIHCKLVAWDPDGLNENKKACHYVKESGR